MPKLVHSAPKYRRHKASGQAVVTIKGKDHYLGPWRSTASRVEYDRLIGEWLAAGRQPSIVDEDSGYSVMQLAAAYLRFARGYYQKDGKPSGSMPRVLAELRALKSYGHTQVIDFGPLALQAIQRRLIDSGSSRPYINALCEGIKRIFRWGASQELFPVTVYQGLATVPGLRRGRTEARETEPIGPVEDSVVDRTMPHMPAVVADMVRLQRLTGARPAEICILRPCDVDMSEPVWSYRPESHKTQHHGHDRVIFVGPKGQDILRPYLLREKTTYCFSPAEGEKKRRAEMHARRVTPLSCGNRPGMSGRKRKRGSAVGNRYTTGTYRQAIHRACEFAFEMPADLRKKSKGETGERRAERLERIREWCAENIWSPNQLRHAAATEIRARFGLEAAQVTLGHSRADVTQVYAERDLAKAAAVMREVG